NSWASAIPTGGPQAGTFEIFSTNELEVVVDLVAFWSPTNSTTLGSLKLLRPTRIFDSRQGSGEPGRPSGLSQDGTPLTPGTLAANNVERFGVNGRTFGDVTIPPDVKGVLVNVTVVQDGPSGGYVTLFSGDLTLPPNASTVNPSTAIASSFWA